MEAVPAEPAETIGLKGLLVGLLAIAALSAVYLGLLAGLVIGVDTLLHGSGHVSDLLAILDLGGRRGAERQLDLGAISLGCLLYVTTIAAIVTVARVMSGRRWRLALAWGPFHFSQFYWLLVLAGCLWGLVASALVERLHPEARDWFKLPEAPLPLMGSFLLIVVLAPLAEELLFRGWIFTGLRTRFSYYPALLGSAVLFALAHWEGTHLYAAAVFPVGLALGWARENTGSVRATALFHGIYNLVGWVLTYFAIA